MMLENWRLLGAVLVLPAAVVLLRGSETALTASSRAAMLRLAKDGNRTPASSTAAGARERLIGALLLGNNAVNIVASSLATSLFLVWFGDVGVLYATVAMTVLVVVFAEVLPKTLAFNAPDRMALLAARRWPWSCALLGPVLTAIEWVVRQILRLIGIAPPRMRRSCRRTRRSAAPLTCCTARAASRSTTAT